jgi:hypothetical protein
LLLLLLLSNTRLTPGFLRVGHAPFLQIWRHFSLDHFRRRRGRREGGGGGAARVVGPGAARLQVLVGAADAVSRRPSGLCSCPPAATGPFLVLRLRVRVRLEVEPVRVVVGFLVVPVVASEQVGPVLPNTSFLSNL